MYISLNLFPLRASTASRRIWKGNSHHGTSLVSCICSDKWEIMLLSNQECGRTVAANLIVDSLARENIIRGCDVSETRDNQEVAFIPASSTGYHYRNYNSSLSRWDLQSSETSRFLLATFARVRSFSRGKLLKIH